MNVEYLKSVAAETLEVVDRGWSVGRRLLLGASGCEVFGNDARQVFGAFEDALLPSPSHPDGVAR